MNYRLTELKVLLFLLLLSAVSCQRPMYDEEDDEDGVSQTNLPLKISARSSGESQINYPAYIYAFAEDGSCSASLKMTDNAQIEMKLPPARYTTQFNPLEQRIGQHQVQTDHRTHHGHPRSIQRQFCGLCIGADQSTRPKQNTAKIEFDVYRSLPFT